VRVSSDVMYYVVFYEIFNTFYALVKVNCSIVLVCMRKRTNWRYRDSKSTKSYSSQEELQGLMILLASLLLAHMVKIYKMPFFSVMHLDVMFPKL
jgi:hypothetical protein